MARYISSMNELEKSLQPVIKAMVGELAERVYETRNLYSFMPYV